MRRNSRSNLNALQGFSLTELLVVLIVIGLISGIALPQLQLSLSTHQHLAEKNQVVKALHSLPGIAYEYGENFEILTLPSQYDWINEQLNLPDGWKVASEYPLAFYASGSCSGGRVTISRGRGNMTYTLSPPYCLISPGHSNNNST